MAKKRKAARSGRRRRSRRRAAMSVATNATDRQATGRSHGGGAACGVRKRQGLAGDARGAWQHGRAHRGAACGVAVAAGRELSACGVRVVPRRLHRDLAQGRDDPDPELRQRVLGILMREKDGYAQKKLLEGLKNPAKALLPPEKALQLLSYDVHAEAYSVGARHRQEAAERRRQARGAAASRGRRQGGADVREGAARQEGVAREPADRGVRAACAESGASCRSMRARSCSTSRTTTTSRPQA